jgi:hypothetical protein
VSDRPHKPDVVSKPKRKSTSKAEKKRERELGFAKRWEQSQYPGINRLLTFLHDIGDPPERVGHPLIWHGRPLLRGITTGVGSIKWDPIIDKAVMSIHHRKVARLVRAQLAGTAKGLKADALRDQPAVAVSSQGRVIALVRPTRARLMDGEILVGNFANATGSEWDDLRRRVARHAAPREKPKRHAAPDGRSAQQVAFVLAELHDGLAIEITDAVLAASRALREERTRALGHRVRLHGPTSTITFDPIARADGRLHVPFRFDTQEVRREGRLRLGGARDPLPVEFLDGAEDDIAWLAWLSVMLGYADLVTGNAAPVPTAAAPREADGRRSPRGEAVSGLRLRPRNEWWLREGRHGYVRTRAESHRTASSTSTGACVSTPLRFAGLDWMAWLPPVAG